MPHKLHFYTHYSKEKIKVTNKALASGGEGQLYTIATPRVYKHLVAKLYYPDKRTAERLDKMHYLIQNPPFELNPKQEASIAWVVDILYYDSKFVGILMRRIKGEKLTQLTLNKLPRRANKVWQRFAFGQKDALKLRMHTCFNIAAVLHRLHSSNRYVLVDLKPDNIMIQPNGLVAMVDLDSAEVVENGKLLYPAPVATPEYTPPEHYHENRTIIDESWDHFSLGVIFYQLLLGLHPFTASAKPPHDGLVSLHDKIKHHLYVHHSDKQNDFAIIPPPHRKFLDLPDALQLLFKQCFEVGATAPTFRPSAQDWCVAFARILQLPFKAIPSNKIALSELYFNVYDVINWKDFDEQQLPELNDALAQLTALPATLTSAIPVKNPNLTLQQNIHKHYQAILEQKRVDLVQALVIILAISVVLCIIHPSLLLLSLFYLFPVFHESIYKTRKQTLMRTIDHFVTFDLIDLKQRATTATNRALAAKDKVLNQIGTINSQLQNIDAKDLAFLQQYNQELEAFKAAKEAFAVLKKTTKINLADTRQEEMQAYQDLIVNHQEQSNYKLTSYDEQGFEKHIDFLNKTIAEKSMLLSIDTHPEYIRLIEKQSVELQLLQAAQDKDFATLWEEKEVELAKQLNAYRQQNSPQNRKEEYKLFTKKIEQLATDIALQASNMQLDKSLSAEFGITVTEASPYIDFYNKVVDITPTQTLIQPFITEFRTTIQQLEKQPIKADHLETIAAFIGRIKSPTISSTTASLSELRDQHQAYKHKKELVVDQLTQLDNMLKKLADDPAILDDKMDVAYWFSDLANLFKLLEQSLLHYHKFAAGFHKHPYLTFIHEYSAKQQQAITKLKQQHPKSVAALEKEYAQAIAYKENPRAYQKQLQQSIDAKKEVLKEAAVYDFEIDKKQLQAKHEKKRKQLKDTQKKAQGTLKHNIRVNAYIITKDVYLLQQELEQVEQDYQAFETTRKAIKQQTDNAYQSYKNALIQAFENLEQQLKALQGKADDVTKIIEYYQDAKPKIDKEIQVYQQLLQDFSEHNDERIKLDTLQQWQEQFEDQIAVQNLLFGGTQPIEIKEKIK